MARKYEGAVSGGGADDGAAFGGLVGVEDGHGNVMLDGGQQGGRMQDLGSEAGQLGGLMEADFGDALGLGTDAGIGGENAADVGPDLDAGGAEGGADEGGGVVRAAAAEGGDFAAFAGGDEAAENRDEVLREHRRDLFLQPGAGGRGQRSRGGMVRVGDDQLAGVGVGRGNAEAVEGRRHQYAGEQLAEGQHVGVLRRSDGFLGGDLGGERGGFGHAGVELGDEGGERRLDQHLAGGQDVAGADGVEDFQGLAKFAARGRSATCTSLSVTPPMALTTTSGCSARRGATMEATRRMAVES